ncbi:DEAD/DEAH box helicase domain protein [Pyrolobus fumarii 1A]|uniref:DEAD/DEAH box helicase domain protein n=1 Tax=Pyrolobus fumarii (strain DSM 11204 / 1A) TaxID=694429 RepID=G0EG22_PYRF1|nr:DEAD/DEAH box helicase [Pyrolobus fumarii]AEM38270.1 DEAD/DEAH box helicase domain protein [Pyrolobus fumarii 1A]
MPIDTRLLLEKLGYSYEFLSEPASSPSFSSKRFEEIHERFSNTRLRGRRLYRHQLETLEALTEGCNVILVAGTGSGKTEAWFMYTALAVRSGLEPRVLALYPTLALAHDQVARLREYGEATGVKVVALDAGERERLERSLGRAGLRRVISEAHVVATNPAFLLQEVKRLGEGRDPILKPFIENPWLIVIDELDFYSPRGVALIDAMLRIIAMVSKVKPRVAVLTATLANPEELAKHLRSVTGRCTRIVRGEPFRVENRVYIVLGKDLEALRKLIKEKVRGSEDRLPRDILEALSDPERFRKEAYRVTGALRGLGFDVPSPSIDITEILASYVEDDGVTLVFTRSIAVAERLARRLREKLGDKAELVAAHHHLVPREERRRVEEAARQGRVKIIFSPRTLAQGVDIGTVVRVVHYGLPEDVREFLQREGRKGRRPDIPFTETVIIPAGFWDRELLGKGVDALREWLSMPLERVIVNPDNLYASLFTGMWKLRRRLYDHLDEREKTALKAAGVLGDDGRVNERRLKWVWERLNFYEFGPPYGIKRYLVHRDGRMEPLEPIGFCDLVEHFQQGCIDLANEAIVTGFRRGGRGHVTAVIEEPIGEVDLHKYPALADALEEYELLKRRWGEEPNVKRDILRGALVSQAVAVVYPPKRGFGRLIKIPNRVIWVVYGEKPLVVRGPKGETIVTDRRGAVYVTGETAGVYTDYTYGVTIELPPWEDPSLARIGLALLNIVLRRKFGIAFETIMYSVERLGDYKAISLHEPEAAGIIERLDWREVLKAVREYEPSGLDTALLALIDEVAYAEFLGKSLDWSVAKTAAERMASIIANALSKREVIEVAGVKLELVKPGPEHKILAVGVALEEASAPRGLLALALFDGENMHKWSGEVYLLPGVRPPDDLRTLELLAQDLVDYEGYKLVVPSRESIETLRKGGLRLLPRLAAEALDAREVWREAGLPEELQPLAVRAAAERLGWSMPDPAELAANAAEALQKGWRRKALEALEKAAEATARIVYLTALLAKRASRDNNRGSNAG